MIRVSHGYVRWNVLQTLLLHIILLISPMKRLSLSQFLRLFLFLKLDLLFLSRLKVFLLQFIK